MTKRKHIKPKGGPKKPRRPRGYADLADLQEDERIKIIAQKLREGDTVAVVVGADSGILERYLQKIKVACGHQVEVEYSGDGPVANSRMLKLKMVLG